MSSTSPSYTSCRFTYSRVLGVLRLICCVRGTGVEELSLKVAFCCCLFAVVRCLLLRLKRCVRGRKRSERGAICMKTREIYLCGKTLLYLCFGKEGGRARGVAVGYEKVDRAGLASEVDEVGDLPAKHMDQKPTTPPPPPLSPPREMIHYFVMPGWRRYIHSLPRPLSPFFRRKKKRKTALKAIS